MCGSVCACSYKSDVTKYICIVDRLAIWLCARNRMKSRCSSEFDDAIRCTTALYRIAPQHIISSFVRLRLIHRSGNRLCRNLTPTSSTTVWNAHFEQSSFSGGRTVNIYDHLRTCFGSQINSLVVRCRLNAIKIKKKKKLKKFLWIAVNKAICNKDWENNEQSHRQFNNVRRFMGCEIGVVGIGERTRSQFEWKQLYTRW